jgi:hypothetical protein
MRLVAQRARALHLHGAPARKARAREKRRVGQRLLGRARTAILRRARLLLRRLAGVAQRIWIHAALPSKCVARLLHLRAQLVADEAVLAAAVAEDDVATVVVNLLAAHDRLAQRFSLLRRSLRDARGVPLQLQQRLTAVAAAAHALQHIVRHVLPRPRS